MMAAVPPQPEQDREFHRPGPGLADDPMRGSVEDYQRLIANPFLGLLAFMAWMLAIQWTLARLGAMRVPAFFAALFAGLFLLPRLFHYHCLDCGATGQLLRWRHHQCAAVRERMRLGRRKRISGPTPIVQVVLWLYVLLAIGVLLQAMGMHLL